jgi:hypothetical protein
VTDFTRPRDVEPFTCERLGFTIPRGDERIAMRPSDDTTLMHHRIVDNS